MKIAQVQFVFHFSSVQKPEKKERIKRVREKKSLMAEYSKGEQKWNIDIKKDGTKKENDDQNWEREKNIL